MKHLCLLLIAVAVLSSCKQVANSSEKAQSEEQSDVVENEIISLEKDGITLTEVLSPIFEDAVLKVKTPQPGTHVAGNTVKFDFDVGNYELGSQTADATTKSCANSAKGQHIHLILNNSPYTAHYESVFDREVEDGGYVGLAFLSRSYHESIKAEGAYQLFKFSAGEKAETVSFDEGAAHMFYSRPKGLYSGDDMNKVLLDFYLINADMASDGYTVKATINGTEFLLRKWVPYAMEGLPEGELNIELALLDATGILVDSPFNPVSRTVTLVR